MTSASRIPRPPPTEVVSISGPSGSLEAAIDRPAGDPRPIVAIVCHPLPVEGGTMQNKVVTSAARALREHGITVIRFNFRGTGASAGRFDDGEGERDDLGAVAAWARARFPGAALWLAGFSFGAYVSIRSANALGAALLLSIAPPAGRSWDFDAIGTPTMPWIVIQGEADEIVDPQDVYAWLDGLDRAVTLIRVPDTSHFFHGQLPALREAVAVAIAPHLDAAGSAAAHE